MKKPKSEAEIPAIPRGGTMGPQFNGDRDFLLTKETSREIPMAQTRPELPVQRYPVAQLNRHQHGVWV